MSFEQLQIYLARWPQQSLDATVDGDALLQRLARVFAEDEREFEEWLPLLRQVLARESARRGAQAKLRLPLAAGWPTPADLQRHGMHVIPQDAQSILVRSQPWYPAWLGTSDADLFADAFAERPSRLEAPREIDPLVREATGFEHYMSPGQRAAVHAVLMAAEDSTLAVTLPTGSGKSLVAQAPPLIEGEGSCTVVVVPTIALAMDQARQFKALWLRRHPSQSHLHFAWHGDTPTDQKQQIKQNLRQGRQPILFTSPESVVGTLRLAIQDAALRGYLRYLVIDEAHLVAQWGDSFRPEFQSLGAFRRGLTAIAKRPFKTVLMTATLTAEALATIETLFTHDDKPVELVASVHLRTEPRYWYVRACSESEQIERVLALLAHAPRPLMLYVTEVEKAKTWGKRLRERGWRRFGVFHGETPSRERLRLIDAWAQGELDVMVATSAFGVGIDKRDVRCVIHACVPESLDRYYQEVGRGGRDGRAMCAVAVYTDEDVRTAEGIAVPSLITSDLGLPRWRALLRHGSPVNELPGTVRVNLATVAPNLNQQSDYNRAWNLRTLMLMARAGVIELTTEPPRADVSSDESPTEPTEEQIRQLFDTVLVRILNPHHGEASLWSGIIENSRDRTFATALQGVNRMKDVFAGRREIGRELQELYSMREGGRRVLVDAGCSGCPVCRNAREEHSLPVMPALVSAFTVAESQAVSLWRRHLPAHASSPAYIVFDEQDPQLLARFQKLSLLLAHCGLREVRGSMSDWPGLAGWPVLRAGSHAPFVALTRLEDPEEELVQVPRLTLLRHPDSELLARLLPHLYRPFDWVVVPSTIRDPHRPHRYLADSNPAVPLLSAIETLSPWAS